MSELSSQFQVVLRFTGLTAISLPESLPFPGKLCGASLGDAGTQEGKDRNGCMWESDQLHAWVVTPLGCW